MIWRFLRDIKRGVNPMPEISVGEEVPTDEGDQIGKSPLNGGTELEQLQKQHGDQCCPNLDVYGIGSRPNECFDLQVLFKGLKEKLDLPAFFINGSDSGSRQMLNIGK